MEVNPILEKLLDTSKIPRALTKKSEELLFQSKPLVQLKPKEEVARPYICCVLAAQELRKKLKLPRPDVSKPPLPPSKYQTLFRSFKTQLYGTVADGKEDDESDFVLSEDDIEPVTTPKRRSPTKAKGTPSPKKPRKPLTVDRSDGLKLILKLSKVLDLDVSLWDVIVTSYRKYFELVTDNLGLAMGVVYVVVAQSRPDLIAQVEEKILRAANARDGRAVLEQWKGWADQILQPRSYFKEVAAVPEPVAPFYGGSGRWTFALEPEDEACTS